MNQTIAGAILLVIWILLMVLWGNSKDVQPDLYNETRPEPCNVGGHPLWADC